MAEDPVRQYFDELPAYVTVQDRDLGIIATNRRFRETFAGDVGERCFRAYKRRTEKCPDCPVEATFADGVPRESEQVVIRSDGQEMLALVHTAPIRDAAGRIVSVMEKVTDITCVKRLQQRYRVLFDVVPAYISVQDRELRLIDANRQFRSDFGDPGAGRCYEVYKHRSEPCLVCPVAATFADGEVHSSEEVVTARDGRAINMLCNTAPIHDPTGEIVSVMEMSTNITELRRLQSQLASLGLLVGSISHGIKGLLSGLDGGIYLLETGFKSDDLKRVQKGWDMVRRNVDRIRSMVLNVLYYAKDREVQWEAVDLKELVTDVCNMARSRAVQLGVSLRSQVEDGAGSFEADPRAVRALVVNLVENSLDACRVDRKKRAHEVMVSGRLEDGHAVLEVADDGIGMDRETREKAFTLFFSSKGTEGTGLGLFIAQRIATAHGGSITVESTPDVGTCFTVRLSRTRPGAGAAGA